MEKVKNYLLRPERLRHERERLGLLQDNAEKNFNVSRVTWGKYERGEGTPNGEVLALLKSLGADMRYLFEGIYTHAEIGGRLREERTRLNQNLKGMAELGGITPELQARYEQGLERPPADYLNRIAEKQAETWYILTGELPPDDPRRNEDERILIAAYRRCTPKTQEALLLMAQNSAQQAAAQDGEGK